MKRNAYLVAGYFLCLWLILVPAGPAPAEYGASPDKTIGQEQETKKKPQAKQKRKKRQAEDKIDQKQGEPKVAADDGRFIAYDDKTVMDTNTGLMWAARDNGGNINWKNAKNYCDNYRGGGYTDWRMPTREELEGLYDADKTYKSDCGYEVHLTKLIRLTCTWVWASETRGAEGASIYFSKGSRMWARRSFHFQALPVRSAKQAVPKSSGF